MTQSRLLLICLTTALVLVQSGFGWSFSLFGGMVVGAMLDPQRLVQPDLLTWAVLLRKVVILGTVMGGFFLVQSLQG